MMQIPNLDKLFGGHIGFKKKRSRESKGGRPASFSPDQCAEIRRQHSQGAGIAHLARVYFSTEPTIRAVVYQRGTYKEKK